MDPAGLVVRIVISLAPARLKLRQTGRRREFHLDAMIAAVARLVAWNIAQQIAIAEIEADFVRSLGKGSRVRECTAAGLFGNPSHKARAVDLASRPCAE